MQLSSQCEYIPGKTRSQQKKHPDPDQVRWRDPGSFGIGIQAIGLMKQEGLY